jgi:hypothetical protein
MLGYKDGLDSDMGSEVRWRHNVDSVTVLRITTSSVCLDNRSQTEMALHGIIPRGVNLTRYVLPLDPWDNNGA